MSKKETKNFENLTDFESLKFELNNLRNNNKILLEDLKKLNFDLSVLKTSNNKLFIKNKLLKQSINFLVDELTIQKDLPF